jgi:hypothetical protein
MRPHSPPGRFFSPKIYKSFEAIKTGWKRKIFHSVAWGEGEVPQICFYEILLGRKKFYNIILMEVLAAFLYPLLKRRILMRSSRTCP